MVVPIMIVTKEMLPDIFKLASDELGYPIEYELYEPGMHVTEDIDNFMYQRGLGFIEFHTIASHDDAALALLAHHIDKSINETYKKYNESSVFLSNERGYSPLKRLYDNVDKWLDLGNRAFYSSVSSNIMYAKKGTLNNDEIYMFENNLNLHIEWLE